MKKGCFNLRQRSRWLLVSLFALLAGGSPSWAQVTESFEDVTLVDADTWGRAGKFSNGWVCVSSTGAISNTSLHADNSDYPFYLYSGGKTGDKSLGGILSSTNNYYLVIPTLISGDVTYYCKGTATTYGYLRFYKVTDNGDDTYTIGSQIGSLVSKNSSSGWVSGTASVGDEETMIAIKMNRMAIDDITYTPYVEGGCKKPKDLTISNVTFESADLSWTEGEEGQDTWQVVYSTDASFDKDAATPVNVNSTSYSFTGLNENTTYYVAVRSYCGAGDGEQSAWVSSSFTTTLAPITSFPWSEDFSGITSGIPAGWDNSEGTTTSSSYKWTYYSSGHEGVGLRFNSYNNSNNNTNFLKTPVMNFPTGAAMQLKFWYKNPKGGDFSVYISNDGGATYEYDLATGLTGASSWTEEVLDIPSDFVNNVVIVFKGTSNYGSGDAYIYLDDVLVKENAAYAMSVSGDDVVSNTIAFGEVKNTSTTKTFTISNDGANALTDISVVSSDASVFTVSETGFDVAAGETKDITVTFVKGVVGEYNETVTISQANLASDVVLAVTGSYATPSVANMAVKVGEEAVGETVAFGNVGKQTTKTITVANTGEADLVISSITSSNTTDFTVSPASLTVHGNSSETFTVTFLYDENARDEEKTANITVTASNEGIDPVVFAVTGTRIEQWSEDFSGNTLPEGWETTSSTDWTIADGVAKGAYQTTSYWIVTPSLIVEEGSSLNFDVYRNNVWTTLEIQMQKNNGSWESYQDISYSEITNYTWKTYTIEGLENGNYRFRFNARGYWLDNFEGFKRNMNDPKLGIYTNAECTVAAAASVTKDFGFVTEAPEAQVYYLKNDGTGTLTLTLGDVPTGFTAALGTTSLGKDESTTLTINMPVETKGYCGGNIVVTAKNSSDVALGTFTVAASGVMVDEDKLNLNFATDNIPATWTANSWSKNANGYLQTSSSSNLETSKLTATAGEEIVIVAKQAYSGSSYTFGVNYKKVGAAEWSTLIASSSLGNSNWITLHASIAEAGDYLFQFVGYYAQIQRIYGLSVPQEPVMVVYDGESLAAATYNFGNVSDEADATWTLTVKNEGQAELTGLAAALTGDDADHYSVEVSATTIAVNGTATITVKQLKDYLGAHTATLTLSATGLDNQVITLSGNTYDHTKQFVDFEDGNLPTGWTKGSYWNVSQVYGQTNHSLGHSYNSSSASSVVTTPLAVAENEVLTFGASRYYSSNAPTLKVRYTADGGLTWSDYTDFSSEITSSYSGNTFKELTLENVPAGTVILEFYGSYVRLDNIYGFTATTAPVFALKEGNTAVANNSTKEFGTLTAEATATYTLTNNGNGAMVSTVATTGVATAAISGEGEGVTIAENTVTLAAGKSATITLTLPYAAPFGEEEGAMTITTEGWVGDFTVNYTATTVDPTALYIDFAGNAKPEGWYHDGWSFTSGYASAAYVANKQMITQKLTCAGPDDVLSFDVWPYTSSYDSYANALTIEYSADRQNWTAFADQPTFDNTERQNGVQVSGAPAGDYYVRFTGSYVYMDNIAGWHKVTGIEHDLYVSATSFPTAALIPETSNGVVATATVYSLRAEEEGVYAKLFFDETEMATSTTKTIANNDYESFTMTCNVPAEEKTYAAKIVVYYSDGTVAWETATTDVVVSQTRTLQITDFALTSEATVEANGDNQFTSTFNVTVKNTGSIAYTPDQVSVSVTDADGNAYGEATTWTAANSQTVYIVPGEYANDNAVLAIYRWSTDNDAEWAEFTKISDNFYSVELNNKTKFIVVRLKNSEVEGYDATNNGLNWANKWNQSVDITPGTANCFTFNGWDDKDGDNHYFGYSTMAELAKGVSTTLKVTVTTSALEGGEFTFKAKENMSNTVSTASATVTVTAAAPKFEIALGSEGLANGDAVAYGTVKEETAKTFTISNTGNKDLELVSIAAPEGFTATAVTEENKTIAVSGTLDIDVTLNAEQGKVSGDLVITYKVDATTNKTFTVALSGRSIAADTWAVDFEDGQIPADWDNSNSWTVGESEGNHYATLTGWDAKSIMTPRLAAEADEELTFDVLYVGSSFTYAYSTDKTNWSDEVTVTATGEQTFVAPAAGNYYLRFTTRNGHLDNLVGFRANPLEHDTEIAASSVPETGKQYNTYTATVTLKESAGKAEEVTASLYVNGEAKATEALAITANGSTVVTLTWEPQEVISEAVEAYVAVTGTGIELATEPVSLTIAEVYTLDEATSESIVDAVVGETILLKRTFVQGWNTVCLPFAITDVEAFFGEGAKAFDFTGYTNGEVNFSAVTTLTASYPYVVYVPAAITEPMKLQNITISSSDNYGYYRESNYVNFQGTYAPIAAGEWGASGVVYGVTSDGHIRKAGASASMKGFRAYFDVPSGTEVKALVFDGDEATSINEELRMKNEESSIYNVAGQRVQKMQKGINIVNGKKIMK